MRRRCSSVLLMCCAVRSNSIRGFPTYDSFDIVDVRACTATAARQYCAVGYNSQHDLLNGRDFRVSRGEPRSRERGASHVRSTWTRAANHVCQFPRGGYDMSISRAHARIVSLLWWYDIYGDTPETHSFSLRNSIPSHSCNFSNYRARGFSSPFLKQAFFRNK